MNFWALQSQVSLADKVKEYLLALSKLVCLMYMHMEATVLKGKKQQQENIDVMKYALGVLVLHIARNRESNQQKMVVVPVAMFRD